MLAHPVFSQFEDIAAIKKYYYQHIMLDFYYQIQQYHDYKLQTFYVSLSLFDLTRTLPYFPTFILALVFQLTFFDLLYNP